MSPTSMSIALGMTYGQYQGQQCGAEILAKLQFPESDDALHETLGAAMRELESRAMPETADESAVGIGLRSSIWGFPELPPAATLQWYGGRTHAISGDLQAAREVINCVIESDSRGLLPDFLPEGQPADDTSSYEINAAVLQAPWLHPLHAGGELSFERDDGTVIELPKLSHALLPAAHHETDAFSVVDLSLRGQALSIMFVVPKPDVPELSTLANNLTAQDLAEARAAAAPVYVDFAMPKVQISPTTIDYYAPLGLACEPYTLRKVLHSAAVELDEKGIKAAAATANESWEDGGGPSEADVSIVLDRPFLFFAYDRDTDFVLYSGRYTGA